MSIAVIKPFSGQLAAVEEHMRSSRSGTDELSLVQQRDNMDARGLTMPVPDTVAVTEVRLGGCRALQMTPDQMGEQHILYWHGGGYMAGSPESHRSLCARLSELTSAGVVCPEYRLAPEHCCPAAVEDALAAYRECLETTSSTAMAVGGDSAGGGLTLALLLAIRDAGLPLPACAFTLSPWVDLGTAHYRDMDTDAIADAIIGVEGLERFSAVYRGDMPVTDTRASPLLGELGGLPPLLVQAGTAEILQRDAVALEQRVNAVGGRIVLELWKEMFHVWQYFWPMLPEGDRALQAIAGFCHKHWP